MVPKNVRALLRQWEIDARRGREVVSRTNHLDETSVAVLCGDLADACSMIRVLLQEMNKTNIEARLALVQCRNVIDCVVNYIPAPYESPED
jgi:hypothetical protein